MCVFLFWQLQEQLEYARFQRAVWEVINKIPLDHVKDRRFKRELQYLATVGPAALPPELLDRVTRKYRFILSNRDICIFDIKKPATFSAEKI